MEDLIERTDKSLFSKLEFELGNCFRIRRSATVASVDGALDM